VVAPVVFYLLWKQYWGWALWLMIFAALTDAADGFAARLLDAGSRTGEVLDPIADKVLLSGAFLAMALNGSIEIWLAALVVGRDVLMISLAGGALMQSTGRRFPPSIWGKASTICQVLFILALVGNLASAVPGLGLAILKWATAALTAWSGIDYARRAGRSRQAASDPGCP
jgi:CDP-diacylglycerol--glycerol-3-phosphate 3-phosphatidyltransferase